MRFTVEHSKEAIQWLIDQGVPFTRDEQSGTEDGGFEFHLTREGGHSHRRIIHAADATGAAIFKNVAGPGQTTAQHRIAGTARRGGPDHRKTPDWKATAASAPTYSTAGPARYNEIDAIDIIIQVAEALQHAHAKGLIHRDVKPKNIMLSKEGVAKLADMGLARATNPRGEQPLPPYGACLLGSVNLTKFVKHPFTDKAEFDWEEYKEVVRVFTRMLDNVVEVNGLPLQQQRDEIMRKRRHGMGFPGLAAP